MPHKADEIERYLTSQMFEAEIADIYVACKEAVSKFRSTNYLFTDIDRDNLIMLASAWSAVIRRTWRIFVIEKGYEPSRFWNAYIKTTTFKQDVLLRDYWKKVFKYWDKELPPMIKKTSNPNFMEKMFTGFNWKQLHDELNTLG